MGISSKDYDFSGWATRANMKCSDGRTIMKDAFIDNDGASVPLVWNHQHNEPFNVLGHALLKNMEEGVYAYCKFNDSESGKMGREMVRNGDVNQLSIYANQLKQQGGNVIHGAIREVSLVLAGANPGAYIDSVICHSDNSDEAGVIFTGEDIVLAHSEDENADEDETLEHADANKKADENGEGVKKEDETNMADTNVEKKEEPEKEKTVQDVFDTLTEEQKTVVYALIGQALEDAENEKNTDEEDNKIEHSEGGNETMYTNVFDRESTEQVNVLSHADQEEIINMAKRPGMTLKSAMSAFVEDHKDTLAHGFETTGDNAVSLLFPEFKEAHPGAPELLERDHNWVTQVMTKARKSPVSRVRTTQVDARDKAIRAKGYKNRDTEKAVSGKVKILRRTTEPQTVFYRDNLHRDDVIDIDFDVISYQRNIMKRGLEEEIALAALVGDGRGDSDPDKISEEHIRPVWHDDDLYTIKAPVDIATAKKELQGTNTSANFGSNYIYAEAIITAALHAREKYKGKGTPDLYVEPHMLNTMLLARDLNGRRIYDSAADLAKVLNVGDIYTVEQFSDLDPREDENSKKYKLLGLMVNMSNYQFGSTKGGEITSFDDFDMDFNTYKYLLETRLSGALTEVYSAIALEEPVATEDTNTEGQG
nr:MAG TPA: major capsid protein [Caudoviricetes sp.]